jgi:hypothetical protein
MPKRQSLKKLLRLWLWFIVLPEDDAKTAIVEKAAPALVYSFTLPFLWQFLKANAID